MAKDPVAHAVRRATVATNLFAKAKAQLDVANELLSSAVDSDLDEIERLTQRVTFARAQHDINTTVANKLDEFVT